MFTYMQLISRFYIFIAPIFAFLYFPMAVVWCSESLGRQKASFPLLMWKAFKYIGALALLAGPVFVGQAAQVVPVWLWAWEPALRNGAASMNWLFALFGVLYIAFLLIVVAVNWFPAEKAH